MEYEREHEHGHEHGHAEHIISEKTYFLVFLALLGLLVISIAVTYVELGVLTYPVAIGIAVIKTILIILYFMHVIHSTALTKLFVSVGFFWLLILLLITMTDFLTRDWLPVPGH
ncbi:MAG: cytochrome C oxidase subunit IV family protein [Chloroflexota bacterium]|nr:cytochrome C oxidase subunit IV family protein [Chloroflexota bacterium]